MLVKKMRKGLKFEGYYSFLLKKQCKYFKNQICQSYDSNDHFIQRNMVDLKPTKMTMLIFKINSGVNNLCYLLVYIFVLRMCVCFGNRFNKYR